MKCSMEMLQNFMHKKNQFSHHANIMEKVVLPKINIANFYMQTSLSKEWYRTHISINCNLFTQILFRLP